MSKLICSLTWLCSLHVHMTLIAWVDTLWQDSCAWWSDAFFLQPKTCCSHQLCFGALLVCYINTSILLNTVHNHGKLWLAGTYSGRPHHCDSIHRNCEKSSFQTKCASSTFWLRDSEPTKICFSLCHLIANTQHNNVSVVLSVLLLLCNSCPCTTASGQILGKKRFGQCPPVAGVVCNGQDVLLPASEWSPVLSDLHPLQLDHLGLPGQVSCHQHVCRPYTPCNLAIVNDQQQDFNCMCVTNIADCMWEE